MAGGFTLRGGMRHLPHESQSSSRAPILRLKVLLVEDDANDVELLRLAFRSVAASEPDVAFNGREAIDAIAAHSDETCWPNLILCDLNMPIMNGFEFLKWLKCDSPCPRTPLVVLSSSVVDADVAMSYDMGVGERCYAQDCWPWRSASG